MPAPELHSGSRPGWPSEHPLLSPAARAGARRTLCLPEPPPPPPALPVPPQASPAPTAGAADAAGQAPGDPPQRPSAGLALGGRLTFAGLAVGCQPVAGVALAVGEAPERLARVHAAAVPVSTRVPACGRGQGTEQRGETRWERHPRVRGPARAALPAVPPGRAPSLRAALTGTALAVLLQLEVGPAPAAVLRGRELHAVVLAAAVAHGAGVDGWGRRAGSAGRRAGGARGAGGGAASGPL